MLVYHSDPTTGEVFETKECASLAEKEHALTPEGGLWYETPRWHRNPRPFGADNSNPYERSVTTPYVELPRIMHRKTTAVTPEGDPVWETKLVKDEKAKAKALKEGYLLTPDESLHKELVGSAKASGE